MWFVGPRFCVGCNKQFIRFIAAWKILKADRCKDMSRTWACDQLFFSEQFLRSAIFRTIPWRRVLLQGLGASCWRRSGSKCDSAAETRRKPHPFGPLQELVNPSLADPKWMEFSWIFVIHILRMVQFGPVLHFVDVRIGTGGTVQTCTEKTEKKNLFEVATPHGRQHIWSPPRITCYGNHWSPIVLTQRKCHQF